MLIPHQTLDIDVECTVTFTVTNSVSSSWYQIVCVCAWACACVCVCVCVCVPARERVVILRQCTYLLYVFFLSSTNVYVCVFIVMLRAMFQSIYYMLFYLSCTNVYAGVDVMMYQRPYQLHVAFYVLMTRYWVYVCLIYHYIRAQILYMSFSCHELIPMFIIILH
jgi:hypothetical protein